MIAPLGCMRIVANTKLAKKTTLDVELAVSEREGKMSAGFGFSSGDPKFTD